MNRRLTRVGNQVGVWLYRRLGGRLSGGRGDVRVLLLTTPGRRTGVPRSTCVAFLDTADGPVVWGSGSGSSRDPDWFRNLRAATTAEVQIGRDRFLGPPRGADRSCPGRHVVRDRPGRGSAGGALRPQGRARHPGRGPPPRRASRQLR